MVHCYIEGQTSAPLFWYLPMVHSRRFKCGREVSGAGDTCKTREKFHNLDSGLVEIIQERFAALFMSVRENQMSLL